MTPSERVKRLQTQLRRLKQDRTRFVSLCAGSAGRGSIVYALDGHGQVWRFAYQTETWVEVGMSRVKKGQAPLTQPEESLVGMSPLLKGPAPTGRATASEQAGQRERA